MQGMCKIGYKYCVTYFWQLLLKLLIWDVEDLLDLETMGGLEVKMLEIVRQWIRNVNEVKKSCFPLLKSLKIFFFLFCLLFRAASAAYGGSQAGGQIEAAASSLCNSHSNAGSKPPPWPAPQLMAMLDPYIPTEQGQGSNLCPHGY